MVMIFKHTCTFCEPSERGLFPWKLHQPWWLNGYKQNTVEAMAWLWKSRWEKAWVVSASLVLLGHWHWAPRCAQATGRWCSWVSRCPWPSSHGPPSAFCHWTFPTEPPDNLEQRQAISTVVVVQSLSHVWVLTNPWAVAHQASPSFTISRSVLKLNVPWVSDAIPPISSSVLRGWDGLDGTSHCTQNLCAW